MQNAPVDSLNRNPEHLDSFTTNSQKATTMSEEAVDANETSQWPDDGLEVFQDEEGRVIAYFIPGNPFQITAALFLAEDGAVRRVCLGDSTICTPDQHNLLLLDTNHEFMPNHRLERKGEQLEYRAGTTSSTRYRRLFTYGVERNEQKEITRIFPG